MILIDEFFGLQQGAEKRAGIGPRQRAGDADIVIRPFGQGVHQGGEQAFVVEDDERAWLLCPGKALEDLRYGLGLAGVLGAFDDPEADVFEVVGYVLVLEMMVQVGVFSVFAQEMSGFLYRIVHVVAVGIPEDFGFAGANQAFD